LIDYDYGKDILYMNNLANTA